MDDGTGPTRSSGRSPRRSCATPRPAGSLPASIYDGEHVDSDIAKRAIELMGTENTMIMTDRCDSARLGRQRLHHEADNTLWYQQDGVVAAGSQPLSRQVTNAREHGFPRRRDLAADRGNRAPGVRAPGRRHAGSSLMTLMAGNARWIPVAGRSRSRCSITSTLNSTERCHLCVVLGHKAHRWFQHRFVQLCGVPV